MTMLNKEWEVNVLSMAKHKLLEKMEHLNKEEYAMLSNTNFGLGQLFPKE